jgi:putative ABC transport system substrate-binding protein
MIVSHDFGRLFCGVLPLVLLLGGVGQAAGETPSQGRTFKIFMVIHRTGAYADTGFRDYLEDSGLKVNFTVRNIENDAAGLPAIIAEIKRIRPDLIYAQSTLVTRGLVGTFDDADPARYITDIPVVFAMVSGPVESGLAPAPNSASEPIVSGRNLTGAIHVVPRQVQLRAMLDYMPVKKLAVVYDPSQQTQREMYAELMALTKEAGIVLVAGTPLNAKGEPDPSFIAPMIAGVAAAKPDLLYIPPVNFFARYSEVLTGEALRHGLPTFCAIEVQLQAKGMMGLVAPLYQVGQLAGDKAEQILRGKKKAGEIPMETLSRFSFKINMPVARQLGLYPPMKILRYAQIIGEEE